MSVSTLNLHYVQIMSATDPPPFRLIWLVQIMSATPPPCFYVFIHHTIWLSITTIHTKDHTRICVLPFIFLCVAGHLTFCLIKTKSCS